MRKHVDRLWLAVLANVTAMLQPVSKGVTRAIVDENLLVTIASCTVIQVVRQLLTKII